jgi:hypothetical protein
MKTKGIATGIDDAAAMCGVVVHHC